MCAKEGGGQPKIMQFTQLRGGGKNSKEKEVLEVYVVQCCVAAADSYFSSFGLLEAQKIVFF